MIPLTALILTYNEQENIGRALSALSSIDQIVIVDSFSTDRTVEIARGIRPDVVVRSYAFRSSGHGCRHARTFRPSHGGSVRRRGADAAMGLRATGRDDDVGAWQISLKCHHPRKRVIQ